MNNEHESNQNVGVPASAVPSPAAPPEKPTPTGQPAPENHLQNDKTEIEKRMSAFERATLRWTRAMFIVTTATALFIAFQWLEMRDAGKQTDRIIVADERLATAMENSVLQAKNSLQATIDQAQRDQRAWVGPNGNTSSQFRPNEEAKFVVVVTNTGKSPALHTYAEYTGKSILKGSPMDFTYPSVVDIAIHSSTVLQPGMLLYLNSAKNPTLNQTQINMLQSGEMIAYIFGKIRYEDIFGKTHHTKFCMVVDRDLKTFKTCSTYNEAD
jgi:hypothetical protein